MGVLGVSTVDSHTARALDLSQSPRADYYQYIVVTQLT